MSPRRVVQLDSSPSMGALYARALAGLGSSGVRRVPVLGSLPGLSALPGLGARAGELPDAELRLENVQPSAAHLHRYQRVCGMQLSDRLAVTYPHMVAFPLAMKLMTDPSFPFPVIGMVHIENRITGLRPLLVSETLDLRVWAQDMREHDRGTQFDVCAEIRVGDEPVWESQSTYLHYGGGGGHSSGGRRSKPNSVEEELPDPDLSAVWEVPDDIGRRYGDVSGDRNPIHMHGLSARLFGMPRAIAHGMWVKARCLAALEDHEPDAATLRASFKLPLLLPSRVRFSSWMEGEERRFSVREADSAKPHLDGALRPS